MVHVQKGKKPDSPELHHYQNIFDELSISDTGLLLQQYRIVLPASLYSRAIKKAHDMGHFGATGIKRQVRAHYHFPHLDTLVEAEVEHCHNCQLFTCKASKEPLMPVHVPDKPWEYVSMDFFGPMPNGFHVLVIQDLCTKYPVAVLMKRGTNAKETIKQIDKIFNNYGRPSHYRSDNGPPFDSRDFETYMKDRGIQCDRSYPYHPQANPVETWMKPLGKCIKIAIYENCNIENAISDLLLAYRTTPHWATGLTPGEILFRHGYIGAFPNRREADENSFNDAIVRMKEEKSERCNDINRSIKRKGSQLEIGQWVYVKNNRRNKFEPKYFKDPWIIEQMNKTGVTLRNQQLTKRKIRHKDDVKPYIRKHTSVSVLPTTITQSHVDTFSIPPMPEEVQEPLSNNNVRNEAPANSTEMTRQEEQGDVNSNNRRSQRIKKSIFDTQYKDFVKKWFITFQHFSCFVFFVENAVVTIIHSPSFSSLL